MVGLIVSWLKVAKHLTKMFDIHEKLMLETNIGVGTAWATRALPPQC